MRAIPIPLLALVITARVSAEGPPPARIEIFTDAHHPVATATHHNATVYRLDTLKRFERQLNVGLPADIKTAKREAIDRVRRTLRRDRGGRIGPALPTGDQPLSDRRLRVRRPGGG